MRVFDIGARDTPQEPSSRVLTVPNLLSFARLAALPVIYLDLVRGNQGRALALLVVFSVTDWLDGYLARRLDQITRLGTLLDPISDRVLFVVVGVGLVVGGYLPLWAVVVLLARDIGVLAVGAWLVVRGGGAEVPAVSRIGKVSTFGLMVAFPLFIAAAWLGDGVAAPQPVLQVAAWVTFAVNLGLHYLSALGYARAVLTARAVG